MAPRGLYEKECVAPKGRGRIILSISVVAFGSILEIVVNFLGQHPNNNRLKIVPRCPFVGPCVAMCSPGFECGEAKCESGSTGQAAIGLGWRLLGRRTQDAHRDQKSWVASPTKGHLGQFLGDVYVDVLILYKRQIKETQKHTPQNNPTYESQIRPE